MINILNLRILNIELNVELNFTSVRGVLDSMLVHDHRSSWFSLFFGDLEEILLCLGVPITRLGSSAK